MAFRNFKQIIPIFRNTYLSPQINLLHTSSKVLDASKVPPALWRLGRLNHVAIATNDLEGSTSLYR